MAVKRNSSHFRVIQRAGGGCKPVVANGELALEPLRVIRPVRTESGLSASAAVSPRYGD